MADQPDIEKIAKGYMDLWQEHLSSVSQDKDMAEIMAKTMTMMNSGAATFANALADAAKSPTEPNVHQQNPKQDHGATDTTSSETTPSDGTPSASLSPEHTVFVMGQLLERITFLEERVAQLEQSASPKPASKVRRRK